MVNCLLNNQISHKKKEKYRTVRARSIKICTVCGYEESMPLAFHSSFIKSILNFVKTRLKSLSPTLNLPKLALFQEKLYIHLVKALNFVKALHLVESLHFAEALHLVGVLHLIDALQSTSCTSSKSCTSS